MSGDTLWTVPGFSYQWLSNGTPIPGATENWFLPSGNGNYAVQVSQNGCSATSPTFSYNVSISSTYKDLLRLFPNPIQGLLQIQAPSSAAGRPFRILNSLGKTVASGKLQSPVTTVPLADLPNGVYFFLSGPEKLRFQIQR
jgi:type 1 fimbria pilin